MEKYFSRFRKHIIGIDQYFQSPYGLKKIIYADWIASGRLYQPIEDILTRQIGPFIGNTHTESSETGSLMTRAYHLAQKKIKEHVNAGPEDVIITTGFGMTSAVVKFQRILGLKTCGKISHTECLNEKEKPVVFVTHMEHHSNHTSWFETIADVVQLTPDPDLRVDLDDLRNKLEQYKDRSMLIGSFTSCSNVTGIFTPYHQMARIMHEYGGLCFIDFAASAPYAEIDMHPADPMEKLDAIFFSPHKFLGGPGSSGVLIFDARLYQLHSPDQPGGGTVDWTNPWGEYKFIDNIEAREDGGTPGFLQAIRTALCIELKNNMGISNIRKREEELTAMCFEGLRKVPGMRILAEHDQARLGVISFYIEPIHYNLLVRLLNDRFGIQARGGCACAGTYGHYLLDVSYERSKEITDRINTGDLSSKPGWVRLSLHPTMTNEEVQLIVRALTETVKHYESWGADYIYLPRANEYRHQSRLQEDFNQVRPWFQLEE
ncbi:MAG TPA: aminotransferase class V-fold PLP-dependent enzyme [Bacteroidales bacterium]|nr:aminotransferase class V-fold PLP-dependent enzyme [Bacteroidales bacterium]HSA44874.1 aminotransferase class V-fold PLP-dependent enzyme [Bacteroidales bacterium]